MSLARSALASSRRLLLACGICACLSPAWAGIIFTSDPGNPSAPGFLNATGLSAAGDSLGDSFEFAIPFTASQTGPLENLIIAGWNFIDSFAAPFGILSDNSGSPGGVIATAGVYLPCCSSSNAAVESGLFSSHAVLSAGTTYWLAALAPPAFTQHEYLAEQSNQGPGVVQFESVDGGGWFQAGLSDTVAFTVASTPEPRAWELSLSGCILLIVVRVLWTRRSV